MLLVEFLIWTFCGAFNFLSWKYTGCLKLFIYAYFILNLAGKNLFARRIWIIKMLCSFFYLCTGRCHKSHLLFSWLMSSPPSSVYPRTSPFRPLLSAADVLVPSIQGQPKLSFTRYWNTEFANSIPGCPSFSSYPLQILVYCDEKENKDFDFIWFDLIFESICGRHHIRIFDWTSLKILLFLEEKV